MKTTSLRRCVGLVAGLGIAVTVAAGCGSSDTGANARAANRADAPNDGARISLVAFSTPREAYEELIPKFQATTDGSGVEFDQSYGASGEQSRAVEGGLPTDVVHLALEPDMTRIVDAGIVSEDWSDAEHGGYLTNSTVALAVRTGNPKKISDWDDLLRDDVEVVTPNPFTSGGARWNLMAAYGAWTRGGDSHEEALEKLEQLLRNTPVQSKSAREALQVFASGKGDVLIAYEQEAIQAERQGEPIEHVVPDSTILIENPVAVTANAQHPDAVADFLAFLGSDDAQQVFASYGYRPAVAAAAQAAGIEFPQPKDLFTIAEFGGWSKVMDEFFDRESGHVADINKRLGVPTDG